MMARFEITKSTANRDVPEGASLRHARSCYLDMAEGLEKWECAKPRRHEGRRKCVWDMAGSGSLKASAALAIMASSPAKAFGYAAPRSGLAAPAIAAAAERLGKRAVFFCPASKLGLSDCQAAALSYEGAEVRWVRIPAMKTLNAWIRKWAQDHGHEALPFGLSGDERACAAMVWEFVQAERHAHMELDFHEGVREVWMALSTGAMARAAEIAFPHAQVCGVQVARSMHPGEKGRARVIASPMPFQSEMPGASPFPTTRAYDLKAWQPFEELSGECAMFVNVGSDEHVKELAFRGLEKASSRDLDSVREWGDKTAFEEG